MKIKIVQPNDELSAEDIAMLQALYSRSDASVDEHLAKVKQLGSAKFMETYYLNYSHKSIGDCGSLTIFIEGVSMPAAKAIQDSPLYNGQECSTRYINYDNCKVRYPHIYYCAEAESVQQVKNAMDSCVIAMTELYKLTYYAIKEHFEKKLVADGVDIEAPQVKNAIHAKACDHARGWLPVGSLTQVAWTTTIRQFNDRLPVLETHPLEEVRQIAKKLRAELHAIYPSSFRSEGYESTMQYNQQYGELINYIPKQACLYSKLSENPTYVKVTHTQDMANGPGMLCELFANRPEKTELPAFLNNICRIQLETQIDYGSFRDIQRHRSANVRHSYPSGELKRSGFYSCAHLFSIEQLDYSNNMIGVLKQNLEWLNATFEKQDWPLVELQYLYPMGQLVDIWMEMGIASAVYIAEIRSGKAVHPTARMPMIGLAQYLAKNVVLEKWLHVDPEVFSTKSIDLDEIYLPRGLQTFKKDTVDNG